jgi:hypothetical protein
LQSKDVWLIIWKDGFTLPADIIGFVSRELWPPKLSLHLVMQGYVEN